jgi:hypothetical protein
MNNKIVIPVSIIITILIVVFSFTQNEIIENETLPEINDSSEIDTMINKIKKDKIENDGSENPYKPTEREWVQSGPFKIDRSQYALGEKLFVNVMKLDKNVKGEMQFTKIINNSHSWIYKTIDFDGSKPQQNFYLGFDLFDKRGICTADQLVGDWEVRFVGDKGEFESIEFKIINQTIPGKYDRFTPVC